MSSRKRAVVVDVAQFVVLTLALSSLFAVLIVRAGHIASGRSLFTRGLMWSPGVAALLLARRRGISWREFGWRWTGRWEWICYVAVIAGGSQTPLIADGDTGYGGLLNVRYTVRGYEAAGAVAIQLEDQEFPKKCGHMLGRRVVPVEDMVDKIKVATSSRDDSNFLIIARTDARTTLGLDEALRRAEEDPDQGPPPRPFDLD